MWSLQQASNRVAPGCRRAHVGHTAPTAGHPQGAPTGLTLSSSASTLKLISAILSNGALRGQQGRRQVPPRGRRRRQPTKGGKGRGGGPGLQAKPGWVHGLPSPTSGWAARGDPHPAALPPQRASPGRWVTCGFQLRKRCDGPEGQAGLSHRPGTWSHQAEPGSLPKAGGWGRWARPTGLT